MNCAAHRTTRTRSSRRLKRARSDARSGRVDGPPVRVTYGLTDMGRSLEPALGEIKAWAQQWLAAVAARDAAAAGQRPVA